VKQDTPTLEVLVYHKTAFVGSFMFTSTKISIGRHPEAMVRLDDAAVSSRHAELSLEGGLFRLRDLGSRTGTRINGAPVLPRQPVEAADQIGIGPFRLRATICEDDLVEASAVSDRAGPSVPPTKTSRPPPGPDAPRAREDTIPRLEFVSAESARVQRPASIATAVAPEARANLVAPAPPAIIARPPQVAAPSPSVAGRIGLAIAPQTATVRGESHSPLPLKPAVIPAEIPPPAPPKPIVIRPENPLTVQSWAFDAFNSGAEDDPDDEDEENFSPPFDLLQVLSEAGLSEEPTEDKQRVTLEVIRYRADRVISIHHPGPKGRLWLGAPAVDAGAFEKSGGFCLDAGSLPVSEVRVGGRALTPSEVLRISDGSKLRVSPTMQVTVDLSGNEKALFQWVVQAPALPPPRVSLRPSPEHARTGAMSLAVHLATFVVLGLFVLGDKKGQLDINEGRFAIIDTKELELEPPSAPPPSEAAPVAPTMPTRPDPNVRSKTQPTVKTPASSTQESASSSNTPTPSTQRLLSALGGAPSPLSAISVSNLDALPVAAGGGFKVSSAVGKAPGDMLRVATIGGSDPDTKSAAELGANDLGKVQARVGTGVVRARVTAVPQGIRGEGTLDRGEIQKVVNAHLYQVQGCYERQLAKDPTLSGKIFFDWVVSTSGGVSSVRIGRSTIHSVETVTCIQSAIQGWKFPPPQGGSVTVTYPFAFSSLGS